MLSVMKVDINAIPSIPTAVSLLPLASRCPSLLRAPRTRRDTLPQPEFWIYFGDDHIHRSGIGAYRLYQNHTRTQEVGGPAWSEMWRDGTAFACFAGRVATI